MVLTHCWELLLWSDVFTFVLKSCKHVNFIFSVVIVRGGGASLRSARMKEASCQLRNLEKDSLCRTSKNLILHVFQFRDFQFVVIRATQVWTFQFGRQVFWSSMFAFSSFDLQIIQCLSLIGQKRDKVSFHVCQKCPKRFLLSLFAFSPLRQVPTTLGNFWDNFCILRVLIRICSICVCSFVQHFLKKLIDCIIHAFDTLPLPQIVNQFCLLTCFLELHCRFPASFFMFPTFFYAVLSGHLGFVRQHLVLSITQRRRRRPTALTPRGQGRHMLPEQTSKKSQTLGPWPHEGFRTQSTAPISPALSEDSFAKSSTWRTCHETLPACAWNPAPFFCADFTKCDMCGKRSWGDMNSQLLGYNWQGSKEEEAVATQALRAAGKPSTHAPSQCSVAWKEKMWMVTSVSASPSFDASSSEMIITTFSVALRKRSTHMPQVDPRFVVTCFIFWWASQVFTMVIEHTMLAKDPFWMGVWRHDKPAHVGPFTWNTTRTPQRLGREAKGAWPFWALLQGYCHIAARGPLCVANLRRWSQPRQDQCHVVLLQYGLPITHSAHILRFLATALWQCKCGSATTWLWSWTCLSWECV